MRYSWLLIIPFIAISCKPNLEEWHRTYAKYKCDFTNLVEERDRSEKKQFEFLKRRQDSIQNIIENKFKVQELRIKSFKTDIIKVEKSYVAEFKKVQDEQNLKYGHVSTPDYEKKLQQLESKRAAKTESILQRLTKEEADLYANSEYITLKKAIDQIDSDQQNTKAEIKDIFKTRLDSLQEKVNNHRVYGKEIKNSLNEKDAGAFQTLMDSINNDPCKYVR